MSKLILKSILTQTIKESLISNNTNDNDNDPVKETLQTFLPKTFNALKDLYILKKQNNKSFSYNEIQNSDIQGKLKKYVISKLNNNNTKTADDKNTDDKNTDDKESVSFNIKENQIVINNDAYNIVPVTKINSDSEETTTLSCIPTNDNGENNYRDIDINNTESLMHENTFKELKSIIKVIDAAPEILTVASLGFEIKSMHTYIQDLISVATDNKLLEYLNQISELCLSIIDTCQIAVDSEQENNIDLIDNIVNILNELNDKFIEIENYAINTKQRDELITAIKQIITAYQKIYKNF
jgi:uncharacterized protein YqgV (UPF0045/DUF77 family)